MKIIAIVWLIIFSVDVYLDHLDNLEEKSRYSNCRKVMEGYILCDDGIYVYYNN